MASTYTTNINLEKPTPGEQEGEWGATLNTNFDTIDTKLAIKDEDDMSSDSASHLSTQQSIKAYVDSQVNTEETIEDFVGGMVTGNTETGIAVTYEDGDGTLDFVVADTTVAGDSGSTGITPGDTLTIAGGTNVTTAMSGDTLTVTSTDTNTQLTQEQVEDFAGGMVSGNTETGISVTYEDSDGTLDFVVSDTTVAGDSGSTGMTPGDTLTIAGGTNVTTAMSGDTLTVTSTDTNTQLTQEQVEDYVGGMLDGDETFITVAYDDTDGNIDFTVPVKDENNMASDSASYLATQQSIKAYVDDNIGATALDDISTGDAASTLATSTGNITIDAQGDDTDIILKGTDGGADTTFVTIDGSDAGTAIFNNDVVLDSDAAVIKLGADQDVTLTHVADTGLILSAGAQPTTLTLSSTLASASVGPILYLTRASGSPADNDICGDIIFTADNDAAEDTTIVQMYSTLLDASDGSEDASLIVQTVENGSYVASLQFKGSGVQVPDGGTFGTVSYPNAIDILATGEVGLGGNSGWTGGQLYVYDNSTTRTGIRVVLDNVGSGNIACYVTSDGTGAAGYFTTAGANYGLYGQGANYGIYGKTTSASHGGVLGYTADGTKYGILGHANAHGLYATSVYCVGTLYKGVDNFRIKHGLREGYDLFHSVIEGPQADLIYRGKVDLVDGQASIDMDSHYDMTPGTFEWLTKSDSVQTFTSNEIGWDAVRSSFSGDTITIECQNSSSTDTISWMVIAERGDPTFRESEVTDDDGNMILERESEPEPDLTPPPGPSEADA